MGSDAEGWLGSFYLGSTEGQIDPSIIQLFRSSDKKAVSGTKKGDNWIGKRSNTNYLPGDALVIL